MAVFPTFTSSDLEGFTGRLASTYTAYASGAIAQAMLQFKTATCLTEWPDLADDAQLASYAVLEAADAIYLSAQYRVIEANPFSSESIGSYSYSKPRVFPPRVGSLPTPPKTDLPTQVTWFDLAVERLGICEVIARVEHGGIKVFEPDLKIEEQPDGTFQLIGPMQESPIDVPFNISRPVSYDPNSSMK